MTVGQVLRMGYGNLDFTVKEAKPHFDTFSTCTVCSVERLGAAYASQWWRTIWSNNQNPNQHLCPDCVLALDTIHAVAFDTLVTQRGSVRAGVRV